MSRPLTQEERRRLTAQVRNLEIEPPDADPMLAQTRLIHAELRLMRRAMQTIAAVTAFYLIIGVITFVFDLLASMAAAN